MSLSFIFVHYSVSFLFFLAVPAFELRALSLGRQMLYYLNHSSSPFCLRYFSGRILSLYLGCLNRDLSTYISHVAGMTDVFHHA
jgi:hypothetical protein